MFGDVISLLNGVDRFAAGAVLGAGAAIALCVVMGRLSQGAFEQYLATKGRERNRSLVELARGWFYIVPEGEYEALVGSPPLWTQELPSDGFWWRTTGPSDAKARPLKVGDRVERGVVSLQQHNRGGRMTATHTYAVLELGAAAYDEIRTKLEEAGYQHAFDDDTGAIDMHGIGVTRAAAALQPHQQRVVDEKAALDANMDRLAAFRSTPTFVGLAWAEQDRMNRQLGFMELYSAVLGERIDAFTPARENSLQRAERIFGADVVRGPVGKLGLPQWKCHKVVGAAKIGAIRPIGESSSLVTLDLLKPGLSLQALRSVGTDTAWIEKHRPAVGGYFVEYEDGYKSFSPAKAFEEGYTRVTE